MKLIRRWRNHLKNNNMTYREHLKFAIGHGIICIEAGIFLIIHGILPCFFERTGSILVRKLKKSFDVHKEETKRCKSMLQ